MKNIFNITVVLFILLTVFTGCVSTPKASGADDLDVAIRDASDYLNDNIPAKSKIVILNMQSNSAALSDYIIDELIANAVNDKNFSVVDRAQLDLIRQEQNFQWAGEVDDNAALEIGKFFGAQTIVSGTLNPMGNRYRMTIRALEVQTAQVQGQFNRNIAASLTIADLMKSSAGGQAAGSSGSASAGGRTQAGTASGGTAQAAATPAATTQAATIPNGTYTFYPRPRAMREGRAIDLYLDKIVVRGGYFNMYFVAGSVGESGNVNIGWWGNANIGLIYNLEQPNRPPLVSAKLESNGYDKGGIYTFSNHNVRRFKFEQTETNESNYAPRVIEVIDLDKAGYEP